jgi:NADPH-dependent 2,4-dienoyl-CoA reductase/sulfur reductase-like enzyme
VKYDELPAFKDESISWAQGSVVKINAEEKSATIKNSETGENYEESYDYLIAATGLKRDWPAVPQSLTREKYLAEVGVHIDDVKKAKDGVVVVGGGQSSLVPHF